MHHPEIDLTGPTTAKGVYMILVGSSMMKSTPKKNTSPRSASSPRRSKLA